MSMTITPEAAKRNRARAVLKNWRAARAGRWLESLPTGEGGFMCSLGSAQRGAVDFYGATRDAAEHEAAKAVRENRIDH